jgi:hypothetical protein
MLIWAIKKFFRVVRQSIILSLLFALSVAIGLLIFSIFYNWYLPKPRIERAVDFELENAIFRHQGKEILRHELVSTVNLFDKISESLHYGQEYLISLVIDLPESDNNFEIGVYRN